MTSAQRFYGDKSIIAFLALLSAFPPLSLDLYLPALPHMTGELGASQGAINLSLSLFLVFFSLGMLVWGPVSEKLGRKPVLLAGLVLYLVGSAGCALSPDVTALVLFRIAQAFGGGAAGAVATAVVKDMYSGGKRESVLALIMASLMVAPVVAPVLGAVILKLMSWRAIFWTLGGFGLLALVLTLLLDETLEERHEGSVLSSLLRLGTVMKNPGFSTLLILFSLATLPLMAFIAASAFVYINDFGMSEQTYSLYFGFNALGAIAGPILFIRLSRWMASRTVITVSFVMLTLCGIVIVLLGPGSPNIFALTMLFSTLGISMMRAPSANILLSQQDGDTGAASSLINFMAMFMGSAGMFMVANETKSLITTLGVMQIVTGVACYAGWLAVRNRPFIRS